MSPAKTTHPRLTRNALLTACVCGVAATSCAFAQSVAHPEASGLLLGKLTGDTAMDRAWSAATLYKDNGNPILEEFNLTGRVQLDYFNVDSDKGQNDFLEIRRLRYGVDTFWANRLIEVKASWDTNLRSYNSPQIYYNRMTDLYVNLHFSDAFNLRVGKFEPHFGYDRQFSDTQQVFLERSFFDDQVFNNTGNDYLAGVAVSGKVGKWGYQAAVFSDNVNQEFGYFNGGTSVLGEISYDFAADLHADKALWAFDYMHMNNNADSNVFNTMENAVATYFDYHNGNCGLVTQLGYGDGNATKGNIFEFMIMPTYLITKQLELVTRYQLGLASQSNGITTLNRQEKTVGKFTGNTDNIVYVGLNYYLYGQKLKLMAGEQYDKLSGGTGYQGWTSLVGLRMFF